MSEENIELENIETTENKEEDSTSIDNSLINGFADEVASYSMQTPDFSNAFNYLVELRNKQLEHYSSLYPELQDINKRNNQIETEALEIIKSAKQSGNNAADFIYNLAKNLGYQNAENQINLAQKQQLQNSAKTLTASNGGIATTSMNLHDLSNMSQAEFDEWYWNNKQEFKRIMGQ